jgi:hypothetical protein
MPPHRASVCGLGDINAQERGKERALEIRFANLRKWKRWNARWRHRTTNILGAILATVSSRKAAPKAPWRSTT